ncbi:unnamed protein product [Rotaria magnacalcarata]|uniref:Protein SPEC3 n=1 Tax=Rotaria magnacalcarata TaxID=392030 RepID=A0A8S2MFR0_9BILA|nr:unnamed protein product [Rotaria magnacalcarata]
MMENSSSPKHDIDENHSRKNEINSSSNRNPRRSHASTSLNQRLSVNKSGANSVKFKPGMFRQAVPQMPLALACFCFVLNLILPGTGTLITAFAVFCCGKHGYEKNIVACLYNLLAAILQSATIFLLVGWIWSVRWGILFIQLAGIINSKKKKVTCDVSNIFIRVLTYNGKLANRIENKSNLSQLIGFFFFLFTFLFSNGDD